MKKCTVPLLLWFVLMVVSHHSLSVDLEKNASTARAIVNGDSMLPTLANGDYVKTINIDTAVPLVHQQLVLISFSQRQRRMVKRVFAIPGDHLQIINQQLRLNGKLVQPEGWPIAYKIPSKKAFILQKQLVRYQFVIPEGYFVLLGDNPNVSKDSLHYGLVSRAQISALVKIIP